MIVLIYLSYYSLFYSTFTVLLSSICFFVLTKYPYNISGSAWNNGQRLHFSLNQNPQIKFVVKMSSLL